MASLKTIVPICILLNCCFILRYNVECEWVGKLGTYLFGSLLNATIAKWISMCVTV